MCQKNKTLAKTRLIWPGAILNAYYCKITPCATSVSKLCLVVWLNQKRHSSCGSINIATKLCQVHLAVGLLSACTFPAEVLRFMFCDRRKTQHLSRHIRVKHKTGSNTKQCDNGQTDTPATHTKSHTQH